MERHIAKDDLLGLVIEPHVLVDDFAAASTARVLTLSHRMGEGRGEGPRHPVGALDGCVENIKNPFTGSARRLEHLVQSVQPSHRLIKLAQIKNKSDELAQS